MSSTTVGTASSTGSSTIASTSLPRGVARERRCSNPWMRSASSGTASTTGPRTTDTSRGSRRSSTTTYHTLGYLREGKQLGPMMQHFHGSVAKLVNDLHDERLKPFWYDSGKQGYFDGCIRDATQARR